MTPKLQTLPAALLAVGLALSTQPLLSPSPQSLPSPIGGLVESRTKPPDPPKPKPKPSERGTWALSTATVTPAA